MHACMLSHFSRVQFYATLWTAAHQAPPPMEFSRQEYWSGLPFPSPMHACMQAKSLQLCPTLCDPMDSSPPGSSVHSILQARLLEWVAMPSSRGIFLTQGIKPVSLVSPALAGRFFTTTVTWEAQILYIHTRFWSTHRTKKIQRVLHKGFAVQRTEH